MLLFVGGLLFLLGTSFTQVAGECGISLVSRVIGGEDAKPGQWPWQIALLKNGRFSCGGSLITSDWVVTAAHCVAQSPNAASYKVRVGEHNRNANEGSEEDIPVRRVIIHPQYGQPRLNNDIALIQLSSHANLQNARVATVCLPAHGEQVPTSSRCFITGWGKIKHPGPSHHILQQANLPPVSNDVCAKKLAASKGGSFLKITPNMICAGKVGTILSGCQGDSGGPFVCQNAAGRWILQGVVSWGSPRCSATDRYTVFARVAMLSQWIKRYARTGNSGTAAPLTPLVLSTPSVPGTPSPAVECISPTLLTESNRVRSFNNKNVVLCDNDFSGGWYRFSGAAGVQIPETVVPREHCGTNAPGWMKGNHPSVAEGAVSRKVCFHWTRWNCQWSTNIQVRNCGNFYVYKLVKPPGCNMRYCGEQVGNGGSTTFLEWPHTWE